MWIHKFYWFQKPEKTKLPLRQENPVTKRKNEKKKQFRLTKKKGGQVRAALRIPKEVREALQQEAASQDTILPATLSRGRIIKRYNFARIFYSRKGGKTEYSSEFTEL